MRLPTLNKRSAGGKTYWYIGFYQRKGQKNTFKTLKSLGAIKESEAKKQYRQYLRYHEFKESPHTSNLTFEELSVLFAEKYKKDIGFYVAEGTYILHVTLMRYVNDFFRLFKLTEINEETIQAFIRHKRSLGKKNRNINMQLTEFKKVMEYAKKEGLIHKLPEWKRLSENNHSYEIKYVSMEDLEKLKEYATERHIDYIDLIINSGLRIFEAHRITWDDIDFKNMVMYVHPKQDVANEKKTPRAIPITKAMEKVLKRLHERYYPRVNPYPTEKASECAFKRLYRSSGIKINRSMLRKTFAHIIANEKGMDLQNIMKVMGHSKAQTGLKHYIPTQIERIREQME